MSKSKTTGRKAASSASKTLTNKLTGKPSKKVAVSALSQTKNSEKTTSTSAAKAGSKVLKDGRTSKDSKTTSGSTLSQREKPKTARSGSKKAAGAADKYKVADTHRPPKKK